MTIEALYQALLSGLGHQGDWPGETKEEIIIGSILVQNTRWENVELSLANLRQHFQGDFKTLHELNIDILQNLIRPSGFFKNKSRSLQEVFAWLAEHEFDYSAMLAQYGDDLRNELLNQFGIGQETADVLLLYVFGQPVFVADKYAQKLFSQVTDRDFLDYTSLKKAIDISHFDLEAAQQFHILIDEFGKAYFGRKGRFEESFLTDKTIIL